VHRGPASGWTIDCADITSGWSVFWLDSDQAGPHAVTVSLTARCGTSGAVRIPSGRRSPGALREGRRASYRTVVSVAGHGFQA